MTSQIIIAERTVYLLPTARLFVTNLREKPWGVCVPRHLCSFFFYHDKKDTIEEKKTIRVRYESANHRYLKSRAKNH